MSVHEHFADIAEVREGRSLFVRCLSIGTEKLSETTLNLVCVHGTVGACKQFDDFWEPLSANLSATPNQSLKLAVWMFDSLGCGRTPVPPRNATSAADFADMEIEKDIHALITGKVDTTKPVIFMGHSYAPQNILKVVRDFPVIRKVTAGFILCNTGFMGDHSDLVNGGPSIFKLPIWLLNCMQPILTKSFLEMGFSPAAKPEVLEAARIDSNKNDMLMCRYYYGAHIWLTEDEAKAIVTNLAAAGSGAQNEDDAANEESSSPPPATPTPSLVLHGVDDQLVPIRCGELVVKALDCAQPLVAVDDAGHEIFEEQPAFVAESVAKFLLDNFGSSTK